MILFHGTNVEFNKIEINKTKKFKDFGQGFYLTDIRSQAEELACKRALMFGGSPIVQEYEFDETNLSSPTINVLKFDKVSAEWANFIYNNRSRLPKPFKHNYDIVIGPIADDGVNFQLRRYLGGVISLQRLVEELKYAKGITFQYFFGTERALQKLKAL